MLLRVVLRRVVASQRRAFSSAQNETLNPVLERYVSERGYAKRALFEKYKEKLDRKITDSGIVSVDHLKFKISEHQSKVKQELAKRREQFIQSQERPTFQDRKDSGLPPYVKPLNSILKLNLIYQEDAATIEDIWVEYHKANPENRLCAVIKSETYDLLHARGKMFPHFVLPIKRNDGHELFYMQLQNHQVAFTPLIEYQAHRDNAPAVLVMNHYTELSDSKGIVLMQGEFDSKRISPEIASQLAHSMQRYYITDQEKLEIVRGFNLDPANFSIASIVDVVK